MQTQSTLRVLGSIEVGPPGAGPATQPTLRPRRLLAALIVRAGEVCSIDRLTEAIWGADQPAHAGAALQTAVSRLRAALDGMAGVELVTRPPGYLLRVDEEALDAGLFERWASEGARLLATDAPAAVRLLDQALSLWRGPAYAEFADEEFASAEANRLEELRAVALEDRIDAALAMGRHHEVAARLEPLVAAEPLRERRQAQLMIARHRAGRSAEALEAFRTYRSTLDEELGIEPSEELERLHTAILRGDPGLGWQPQERPESPGVHPGNLPAGSSVLFGRDVEERELRQLLRDPQVVTLTGPGGVGKTSLATAVARLAADDYPDGTWLVELAAIADPASVPLAVATALDVPARQGASTLERITEWLSAQRALLVLDNCEHLLDSVATLVDGVRGGAPGVGVLATSHVPLSASGEQVYAVGPLDLAGGGRSSESAAVQLFVARATAHHRGFRIDSDNAGAIEEVCRRLDCLPLAIELAAARMRAMSPADLAARLSGRFRLLHGGARTGRERHRTLRALVDWSFDLLEPDEQRVFEVLSVFAGSFTLAQAERLAVETLGEEGPDTNGAADMVLTLVDRSMVVSRPGAPTTYHLLETLRAYGLERLAGRAYADVARRAHALQFADLVAPTAADLYTPRHLADVSLVSRSLDELRTAFAWALEHDPRTAARIVAGGLLLLEHRMNAEVGHWAATLLAALDNDPPGGSAVVGDDLARVHAVMAAGARFSGALDLALEAAMRAEELAEDPFTRCYGAYLQGEVALFQGNVVRARETAARATETSRSGGLRSMSRMIAVGDALIAGYDGHSSEAAHLAAEITAAAEDDGEVVLAAWAVYTHGEALLESDPDAAAPLLADALDRATAHGDRYLIGVSLVSVASALARHGDPDEAVPIFRRAVEHWHRAGNWTHQWTTLRNVVVLLARLGLDSVAATVDGALLARDTSAQAYGAEAVRLAGTRADLVVRLGQKGYDEAARAGARMSDEALVAFVSGQLTDAAGRT